LKGLKTRSDGFLNWFDQNLGWFFINGRKEGIDVDVIYNPDNKQKMLIRNLSGSRYLDEKQSLNKASKLRLVFFRDKTNSAPQQGNDVRSYL
jgi:hypothetical protein